MDAAHMLLSKRSLEVMRSQGFIYLQIPFLVLSVQLEQVAASGTTIFHNHWFWVVGEERFWNCEESVDCTHKGSNPVKYIYLDFYGFNSYV